MKAIVAVDEEWGIGKDGGLLCHLSADLKRFKALTIGKPVILGRKTLDTFPNKRPLPNRPNFILTRNRGFEIDGANVSYSVHDVVLSAGQDAIVIGGGEVYRELLQYCDTVDVTKIHHNFHADTFFQNLDMDPSWVCEEKSDKLVENGISFCYCRYKRIKRNEDDVYEIV